MTADLMEQRMNARRAIRHAERLSDAHDQIRDVLGDWPEGVEEDSALNHALAAIDRAIAALEDVG